MLIENWLMLVGGVHCYTDDDGERECEIYNDTTLLALDPAENPVPQCLKHGEFLFDVAVMHGGTDKGVMRSVLLFC